MTYPDKRWRDELWELIRQYARHDCYVQRDTDATEIDAHLDVLAAGVPVPAAAGPIWPIARLFIDSGGYIRGDSHLYAPGLPEGVHDVYPLPVNADAVPVASGAKESA